MCESWLNIMHLPNIGNYLLLHVQQAVTCTGALNIFKGYLTYIWRLEFYYTALDVFSINVNKFFLFSYIH